MIRIQRFPFLSALIVSVVGGCDRPTPSPSAPSLQEGRHAETIRAECEGDAPIFDDPWTYQSRADGDTFIEILDVAVTGEEVLACTGTQGLTAWSRDLSPRLLFEDVAPGRLSHPRFPRCQHLAVQPRGGAVAITNRGDEVQPEPFLAVYKQRKRRKPKLAAVWSGSASIEGVAWAGDLLVAAAHQRGLLVFSQNGADLVELGSAANADSDAWDVAVRGSHAFVANGTAGLSIVDISDPAHPKATAQLELPGSAGDISLDPKLDRAYLATKNGIAVVDIRERAAPRLLAHVDTPGTALMVRPGAPGVVLVADWSQVRAYDVADSASPRLVGSIEIPTGADFSRVLALDADQQGEVFAGEWQGLHRLALNPAVAAPDVDVDGGPAIRFGRVASGHTQEQTIWLSNRGVQPLSVLGSSVTGPLELGESCLEIKPGGSAAVSVKLTPTDDQPLHATVVLDTNDPDEPHVLLEVTANEPGLNPGDQAPPLRAVGLDGRAWDSASLRGQVVVLSYFATF